MSISQQLVRKLLKAHTTSQEVTGTTVAPSKSSSKGTTVAPSKSSSNRKRKKDSVTRNDNDRVATEDDIVKWHTDILLATDRAMAASVDTTNKSSKSNAAAFHKIFQRKEQKLDAKEKQKLLSTGTFCFGTARSSSSSLSQKELVKIPTFNKERHEKQRKERKRMKLATALEKLNAADKAKNNKTKKPKRTIFG